MAEILGIRGSIHKKWGTIADGRLLKRGHDRKTAGENTEITSKMVEQ